MDPVSASRARVDERPEEASGEIDVMEHGRTADGEATSLDRRLFMQLQAFGGARDTAALVLALEAAGVVGALYEDANDPTGVALAHAERVAGRVRLRAARVPAGGSVRRARAEARA